MLVLEAVNAADVQEQSFELLPARAALSLINIAPVVAVNIAIAINAASVGSTSAAGALQGVGLKL